MKKRTDVMADDTAYCVYMIVISGILMYLGSIMAYSQ